MKIINGKKYYTAKEVGMLVNRTHLTVHLWDKWSNELSERGDKRLIPEPIKIGKQKTRYWSEDDISAIEHFANNIQRGDLAEFSQRQWGKGKNSTRKKKNISEKKMIKSIESRKELLVEEKLILAFIYLLEKEGKDVTFPVIESFFSFKKEKIQKALQKLIDLSFITQLDEKYVLI